MLRFYFNMILDNVLLMSKKLINSHPNLETLPLDELYNPDVAISMKGDCYDNNFRHLQQD